MSKWIKNNASNILLVVVLALMFFTGRFNILYSKIKAMFGEHQGETAYAFSVNEIKNNKNISLKDFKGKVVLVDFWATWCPPCRYEIPELVDIHNRYKDKGFEIIGLSFDRNGKEPVIQYMEQQKISYPVAFPTKDITDNYKDIESIPTAFLIDKNGFIYRKYIGITLKSTIENDINYLLSSKN